MGRKYTDKELKVFRAFGKKKGRKPYTDEELMLLAEGDAPFKLEEEARDTLRECDRYWNGPISRAEAQDNFCEKYEFTQLKYALSGLVSLIIDKGVFTQEEYQKVITALMLKDAKKLMEQNPPDSQQQADGNAVDDAGNDGGPVMNMN